jgi:hypothetical protein
MSPSRVDTYHIFKVVEFDTPHNLIQKEDGVFRNMCLKSGTFGELEAAAKAKAARDQQYV